MVRGFFGHVDVHIDTHRIQKSVNEYFDGSVT